MNQEIQSDRFEWAGWTRGCALLALRAPGLYRLPDRQAAGGLWPAGGAAEGYGFDAVTVYNDMLYQPAWLPLLEMARARRGVCTLGVAAVNPFTCHPINIAGNIALIDEASNGRAYLGVARGGWLDFVGVTPRRPVAALREAMALRAPPAVPRPCPASRRVSSRLPAAMRYAGTSCGPISPFCSARGASRPSAPAATKIDAVKIGGSANPDVIPYFRRILDLDAEAQTGE